MLIRIETNFVLYRRERHKKFIESGITFEWVNLKIAKRKYTRSSICRKRVQNYNVVYQLYSAQNTVTISRYVTNVLRNIGLEGTGLIA